MFDDYEYLEDLDLPQEIKEHIADANRYQVLGQQALDLATMIFDALPFLCHSPDNADAPYEKYRDHIDNKMARKITEIRLTLDKLDLMALSDYYLDLRGS